MGENGLCGLEDLLLELSPDSPLDCLLVWPESASQTCLPVDLTGIACASGPGTKIMYVILQGKQPQKSMCKLPFAPVGILCVEEHQPA